MKGLDEKTNEQRSVLQETLDEADPVRELEWSDRLREKFPPEKIGKLPRGNTDLDYVGHADVTERLLEVDPFWNWEPVAVDEHGMPLFVRSAAGNPIGLWIKLTVCKVTRLGYGNVDGRVFDPEKQLIGDAIRNAAMRFGVALQCWSKSERETAPPSDGGAGAKPSPSKSRYDRAPKPPGNDFDHEYTEAEKAEHAAAFDKKPADAPPVRLPMRTVQGVTITIPDGWDVIRKAHIQHAAAVKFGGKVTWAKQLWGWAIEGDQDGAREVWLAALVGQAKMLFTQRTAIPIPLQCAVLAYDALQAKRSPPPGDSLCPTSEMEEKSFEGMKEGGAADEDPG